MHSLQFLKKITNKSFYLCSLFFFLLLPTPSTIAGVIYDEQINGDFSELEFTSSVGTLSNGSNEVLGSTFYQKNSSTVYTPVSVDKDTFSFTLTDAAIVSFMYTVTALAQTDSYAYINFNIWNEAKTATPANPGTFSPLAAGSSYYINSVVFDAGTYEMLWEYAGLGPTIFNTGRVDWSYSWDMNVSYASSPTAVPVPPGIWLFTSALMVLLRIRKK